MISLAALMLPSLHIIGPVMKNVSDCSRKPSFPTLKPKEWYSLIVMDTFKDQDNAEIKALCLKNDCELVIVPHNLTNKFQPLDISINQKQRSHLL